MASEWDRQFGKENVQLAQNTQIFSIISHQIKLH